MDMKTENDRTACVLADIGKRLNNLEMHSIAGDFITRRTVLHTQYFTRR